MHFLLPRGQANVVRNKKESIEAEEEEEVIKYMYIISIFQYMGKWGIQNALKVAHVGSGWQETSMGLESMRCIAIKRGQFKDERDQV